MRGVICPAHFSKITWNCTVFHVILPKMGGAYYVPPLRNFGKSFFPLIQPIYGWNKERNRCASQKPKLTLFCIQFVFTAKHPIILGYSEKSQKNIHFNSQIEDFYQNVLIWPCSYKKKWVYNSYVGGIKKEPISQVKKHVWHRKVRNNHILV